MPLPTVRADRSWSWLREYAGVIDATEVGEKMRNRGEGGSRVGPQEATCKSQEGEREVGRRKEVGT